MSTTTRNPFDALSEDFTGIVEKPQPKQVSSDPAPQEIAAKQTTSKKRDPTRQTAAENRRGGEYAGRGGRGGKSRGPQNANEQYAKDKTVGHDANAAASTEDTVARGTARGRGRGRGSGTRREFDRRNASGKTDTAKATEQSWGNEAEAQQSASAEPVDAQDPAAPEAAEAAPEAAAPEEEEDNTVSYEDYLKQKAEKALSISAPQVRKANEGADDSKWAGQQQYARDTENDQYFAGVQKQKASSQKERKQKETLEIEQRFYQAPAASRGRGEGRGRGGRGAPRGRGEGRGAGRGGDRPARAAASKPASQGANLSLSDDTAFPSLS